MRWSRAAAQDDIVVQSDLSLEFDSVWATGFCDGAEALARGAKCVTSNQGCLIPVYKERRTAVWFNCPAA
ncbi:hypothetical protein BDI4_920014 [Burkholderia diffusa]|nr:hypothetical protein BDI4_920014 [Burkholderia diffusa]